MIKMLPVEIEVMLVDTEREKCSRKHGKKGATDMCQYRVRTFLLLFSFQINMIITFRDKK